MKKLFFILSFCSRYVLVLRKGRKIYLWSKALVVAHKNYALNRILGGIIEADSAMNIRWQKDSKGIRKL